jgi:hypothetical protein
MDEGGGDAPVIHPPGWDPNSTALALQAVKEGLSRPLRDHGAHDIIFSSNIRMAAPGQQDPFPERTPNGSFGSTD